MSLIRTCRLISLILGGVLASVLTGCSLDDEARRYQVPKKEPAQPAHDIGAMVSAVPPSSHGLRLAYDTPEGWLPGSAGGMRKAVFVVQDGERKVEITAIDLAARAGTLLPNVNRWRGQIELGEITQGELDKSIIPIPVAGIEGHYVELMGPEKVDKRQAILAVVAIRGEKAWFFKLWGDAELATREKAKFEEFVKSVQFVMLPHHGSPSLLAAAGGGRSSLQYEVPESWTPSEARGIRRAVFHMAEGDRKLEITVMVLPESVESLLPNVNLWRKTIGRGEITQIELEKTVKPIQVAGIEGHYIELVGLVDAQPRPAILRVVAIRDGRTWLFSMTGDADQALREKEQFLTFVRSVKFSSKDGAENGE